jgi:hypothetical protein
LTNHKILFFTDNAAVVDIINNTTCKDKVIMKLVHRLVVAALKYNIFFRAKGKAHIEVLHVIYQQKLEKILYKLKLTLTLLFLREKCITALKRGKYEVAARYKHFLANFGYV